jgi:hypothetical protein
MWATPRRRFDVCVPHLGCPHTRCSPCRVAASSLAVVCSGPILCTVMYAHAVFVSSQCMRQSSTSQSHLQCKVGLHSQWSRRCMMYLYGRVVCVYGTVIKRSFRCRCRSDPASRFGSGGDWGASCARTHAGTRGGGTRVKASAIPRPRGPQGTATGHTHSAGPRGPRRTTHRAAQSRTELSHRRLFDQLALVRAPWSDVGRLQPARRAERAGMAKALLECKLVQV